MLSRHRRICYYIYQTGRGAPSDRGVMADFVRKISARITDGDGNGDGRPGDNDGDIVTERKTRTKSKTAKPPLYKVILLNDDYTPMEFVVEVLKAVFHKPHADATRIMLHVHQNGMGVAGVYPFEVAETKTHTVEELARQAEYPLKCEMEKEKQAIAAMPPSNNNIMISRELQVTLQLAMTEAVNRRHEFVCLEHLLFAMLHDVTTTTILKSCGADLDALRRKLAHYLDEQVERMPKGEEVSPRYAIGVQRALQRAALHVQSAGRQEITGGNVLVAMFHETESPAIFFLQEQGVTRFDVINFISHGVSKAGAEDDEEGDEPDGKDSVGRDAQEQEGSDEDGERKMSPPKALNTYAINLAKRAADGKIDPLVGRKKELERAVHVLLRRRKNNPVFVGEAGVGRPPSPKDSRWRSTTATF